MEARALARIWRLPAPKPGHPVHSDDGPLAIEVHLIGIGGVRMPAELLHPPVAGIILAGLAGALDPALAVGDIVIDDCPAPWLPEVAYRSGRIVASKAMVCTPMAKQKLFEQTRALAVDMESNAVREAALAAGAPFVSVRAISDAATDALDPSILKLVNAFGVPRPASIAWTLLRNPRLTPQLKRLGADATTACAALAPAVEAIVNRIRVHAAQPV